MEIGFPGGKKVEAIYKGRSIMTDQNIRAGGEESAPEPFALFLASIGTCAGIYVLVFCQKRNIPTDHIKITLDWEINSETKLISKFKMNILLPPEFPEKYQNAVIKAAELCTVARTIESAPEIKVDAQILE